jgi:hypothetical protein
MAGVGIGGGMGWSGGSAEVNPEVKIPSGVHAASVVHLAPEVGYFVRPSVLLSLQARVQYISSTTGIADPTMTMCGSDHVCAPAHGALAVFARAAWFKGDGNFRPYVAGMIGAGQIRHVASLPGRADCQVDGTGPVRCVDTVVTGPVLVGAGGGLMVNLASAFALTLGLNAVVGFPSNTFNIDLNGGFALKL